MDQVPRLADQGLYLASESTFYRVLKAQKQLGHRGAERPAQARHKPRALAASALGQLYSWDITYLPTPVKGSPSSVSIRIKRTEVQQKPSTTHGSKRQHDSQVRRQLA